MIFWFVLESRPSIAGLVGWLVARVKFCNLIRLWLVLWFVVEVFIGFAWLWQNPDWTQRPGWVGSSPMEWSVVIKKHSFGIKKWWNPGLPPWSGLIHHRVVGSPDSGGWLTWFAMVGWFSWLRWLLGSPDSGGWLTWFAMLWLVLLIHRLLINLTLPLCNLLTSLVSKPQSPLKTISCSADYWCRENCWHNVLGKILTTENHKKEWGVLRSILFHQTSLQVLVQ